MVKVSFLISIEIILKNISDCKLHKLNILHLSLNRNHMKTQITCPQCKSKFNLEDVLTEDVEKSIKQKYELENQKIAEDFAKKNEVLEKEKALFEEKKKKENELFIERVNRETESKTKLIEAELLKKMNEEHQVKLKHLEVENLEKSNKLKVLQQKELEVLQLNKQLADQKENEAHNLQKQKLEIEAQLKEKLSVEILNKEREKHDMEKRELEKQLNDQKKLTEQMSRKLEQGSMQTQGEVQELALEEILLNAFPYDEVKEVGKGKRGADCLLVIKNQMGQACGKIIFESKRTKEFDKKWLPKLKEDSLESGCDTAVLVTQVMPDELRMFEQRDGVWVCKFAEVVPVVKALREGIINVARANKSQENKGEKKEMLYNYFTGNEFQQQMRAINEAYLSLKSSLDREKLQMEKMWKEREKQIDKVLYNNQYLLGSIKGIAGEDINDGDLLE